MNSLYNKSGIMRKAWYLFRNGNNLSFSEALENAWKLEKISILNSNNVSELIKSTITFKKVENTVSTVNAEDMIGCASWYANAKSGAYLGD